MKEPILVLAPHTDDETLGCGGTISQLTGKRIYIVAFSLGKATSLEFRRATETLGIKGVFYYEFTNRRFLEQRQEILDTMDQLKRQTQPAVVFVPNTRDTHQDHQVITQEAIRAFRAPISIFGYEEMQNNLSSNSRFFIPLREEDLDKKVSALAEYQSQAIKPYMEAGYIRGLARVRGLQAGCDIAEAFEVIRCIAW